MIADIELRHFRYFLTVAEEGNFTRAAKRLHVAQPTLSHQILQLEERCGERLFERRPNAVQLTPAGEVLERHARTIFKELGDASDSLREMSSLASGTLALGIVHSVNFCRLPEIVASFAAKHVGLRLLMRHVSMAELAAGLESGRLDIGVGFVSDKAKGLIFEPVFSESLVIFARADSAFGQRKMIKASELCGESLISPPRGYCVRELIDEDPHTAALNLEFCLEADSTATVVRMVKLTGLPAILPQHAYDVASEPEIVRVPLVEPELKRVVGLVRRDTGYLSKAARAFAESFKKDHAERCRTNVSL